MFASSRVMDSARLALLLAMSSIVAFASGCFSIIRHRDAQSIELPPDVGVPGVHFGMSLSKLVRLRPAVRSSAHVNSSGEWGEPDTRLDSDVLLEKFPSGSFVDEVGYQVEGRRVIGIFASKKFASNRAVKQIIAPYAQACLRAWGAKFRRLSAPFPTKHPNTNAGLVWTSNSVVRTLSVTEPCFLPGEDFCVDVGISFARPGREAKAQPSSSEDIKSEEFKRIGLDDESLSELKQ